MDDDKKRLRHIMQMWLCATDPEQRAELAQQVAELQAQKNAAPGKDPGGAQGQLRSTPTSGGSR